MTDYSSWTTEELRLDLVKRGILPDMKDPVVAARVRAEMVSDAAAINSDWVKVGNDLKNAFQTVRDR